MLIRSEIQVDNNKNLNFKFTSKKCTSIKCKSCNYIVECSSFQCNSTKKVYKLKQNFSCKTTKVIYLITCNRCNMQYVGQTSGTLGNRLSQHLSCIRNKNSTPIGLHFNLPNHNISDFRIHAIEQIKSDTNIKQTLEKRESFWLDKLSTHYPLGINHFNIKYTKHLY